MKNRPTSQQLPGRGSFGGGWTQDLEELWTQLQAELRALRERTDGTVLGEPASYAGSRVFRPQVQTRSIPQVESPGESWLVNYVVPDGQTYEIPVVFPGPGVFVARSIDVSIYQRLKNPSRAEADLLLARTLSTALGANVDAATLDLQLRTSRFSLLWRWFKQLSATDGVREDPVPVLNYFWNFVDSKSQRYLSDGLMSHLALQPMTAAAQSSDFSPVTSGPIDGGSFDFDVPWVFERDGQASFHFRPITAIYQFDATVTDSAVTGLQVNNVDPATATDFSDLEGGKRHQDVTVQVELFGERFQTLQDAMRQGALTRPLRSE